MSKDGGNIRQKAFFSLVSGEVHVWDAFECALTRSGMSMSAGRFIPLFHLADGPMRLQELVVCTHAKESAMSRMVERMVKDGLVEKARDERDGRAVLLHITEEGREAERRARAIFEQCLEETFAGLAEEDLDVLCGLLARIEGSDGKTRA